MPLRAMLDAVDVLAPLCADEEWDALRVRARDQREALTTACCGWPAIPRTSSRGTRHFAHRPGADCQLTGETFHHLQLKTLLVRALIDNGWDASTEVAGEGWRADVLATRGPERIAFEVQWSQQDAAETMSRTARYAESGVRVVWLMRQKLPIELRGQADMPCFRVAERDGDYDVEIVGGNRSVTETVAAYLGVALWPRHDGWTSYRPDRDPSRHPRPHDAISLDVRRAAEAAGERVTVSGRPAAVAGAAAAAVALLRPSGWAVVCQSMPLQKHELAVQRTRLTEAGWRPAWVTCKTQDDRLLALDAVVFRADDPHGESSPAEGQRRIDGFMRMLLSSGPQAASSYRPAPTQLIDLYVWDEDCWKCDKTFERVGITGTWESRCGRDLVDLESPIELADADLGRAVKEAIADGRVPTTARVLWRWATRDATHYWANVCPHCDKLSVRDFNHRELVDAIVATGGEPTLRIRLPTPDHVRRQTVAGAHVCAGAPSCAA